MRRLAWLVVVLVPTGAAEILIEDPEGDGGYHLGFPPVFEPVEGGSGATVDLLSLAVRQEGQSIVVEVEQRAPLRESRVEPYVEFSIAGHDVLLHMWTLNAFDDGFFPAYLVKGEERKTSTGYVDEERRVWGAKILMHDLRKFGIEPVHGDRVVVQGAWADAAYAVRDGATGEYNGEFDRIPDGLDAGEHLPLVVAEKSSGGLHLRPETPSRSSNGAATVFVYDLVARNMGDTRVDVTFAAEEVPEGWQVVVPAPTSLEAGGETTVAALAALPSRHVHGTEQSFILRAVADDAVWAETRVGVHFPDIPEPSGHHPEVTVVAQDTVDSVPPEGMDPYFGNFGFLALTTLDVDAADEPVRAVESQGTWSWSATSERMSQGIDVDLQRTGAFTGSFASPVGMTDVQATFWVSFSSSAGSGTVGAAIAQIGDLPRDERVDVNVPLLPDPSGDHVPGGNDGALFLWIEMTGTQAVDLAEDRGSPHLYPGAVLDLPLLEYHDPVEQRFSRGEDLVLTANSTRRIVPGGTGIFAIDVHNEGERRHDIEVRTISSVAQPRILDGTSFRLAAGETRTVHVALDAPSSGQSDAVLLVTSKTDSQQRQALLLRTIVDPAGTDDAAAEAELNQAPKKSPVAAALLPVALGLALLVRRW